MSGRLTLYLDVFAGLSGDMLLGALLDLGAPVETLRAVVEALGLNDEVRLEVGRAQKHTIVGIRCHVILRSTAAGRSSGDPPVAPRAVTMAADTSSFAAAVGEGEPAVDGHPHGEPRASSAGADRPSTAPDPTIGERGRALAPHDHADSHDDVHHSHGPERPYRAIVELLRDAPLPDTVRHRAERAFALLADAEAEVHGVPTADVTFHEVGGADALVDIVGTCALLEAIGPDRIVCSPIPLARAVGRGAHGAIPIPAPATLNLLRAAGAPIRGVDGPDQSERVTPTGAALAMALADAFGPLPSGRVRRVGYGAGRKDFTSVPNLLRLILLEGMPEESAPDTRSSTS